MTVKELKDLLVSLPDDLPVLKTGGEFYPLVNSVKVITMYKLTEEQKKCYRLKHMPTDRWFGKEGKEEKDAEDPQIFDALLID